MPYRPFGPILFFTSLALVSTACRDTAEVAAPGAVSAERAPVVYGDDERADYWEVSDPALQTLTRESIVALVDPANLDTTNPNDVQVLGPTLGVYWDLCNGERYADQPITADCSATLIDDDLVLTAGHCVTNQGACNGTWLLFNYYEASDGLLATIQMSRDVYQCQQIVVRQETSTVDYGILQLDRPVDPAHAPATVHLVDAALQVDDGVTLIGFPSGLPAKIDAPNLGGGVGPHVTDPRSGTLDFFSATTDSFGGNSGSGVFRDFGFGPEVVGILVRGETDYYRQGGCWRVNVLAEGGNGNDEDSTYVMRAIDDLCNTAAWPSARLCETVGDGWCDPCVTADDCPVGWSCEAAALNPAITFCAQACAVPADCNAGHSCSAGGYCEPDLADACYADDVWTFDVCNNRLVMAVDCTAAQRCESGACVDATAGELCVNPTALPATTGSYAGDLTGYVDDYDSLCPDTRGAGPDRVYELTLDGVANLIATVSGYDSVLYLRSDCADPASLIVCNDDNNPPGNYGSQIVANNLPPGTYALIVDAYDGTVGSYSLDLQLNYACLNQCPLGEQQCVGDDFQVCELQPSGCSDWGAVQPCDDGAFCNGAEGCTGPGACMPGSDPCGGLGCDEVADVCSGCLVDGDCDDGLFCTGVESCDAGSCLSGSDPCPGQVCDEGAGACVDCLADGDCADGAFCNGVEFCAAGLCQPGAAIDCADSLPCTLDSCDEVGDLCLHLPDDSPCDDGLFCNGAESCRLLIGCDAGAAPCPGQLCDESGDLCVDCLVDADCDDALFCNGLESCVAGTCQASAAIDCDDGVGCTADSCDEVNDTCVNAPADGGCGDGVFCNGVELCDPINDCQPGGEPCPGQLCDEAGTSCVECLADGDCDDGLFCTGVESCAAGTCAVGGDPCIGLACDESGDTCVACAVDGDCDDGASCNGAESCAAGACLPGTPLACDDGVACTVDACDESSDTCASVPDDALCDDGLFCNGAESCDAVSDCQPGATACAGQLCDEAGDACVDCLSAADCNDGSFCTGVETCVAGACAAGIDPCPAAICDEGADACVACGVDADCDDAQFCTGAESCVAGVCTAGADPCPGALCDEAGGGCVACLSDADCDDGLFCTGVESCAAGACQAGVAVTCDDGVACTTDSCSEALAGCDFLAEDAACDDGLFCTGVESCDVAVGCLPGVGPCVEQLCDEAATACVACLDATDCDDGLFCTGDEACVAGVCVAGVEPCAEQLCDEAGASCVACLDDVDCDDGAFCTGSEGCVAGTCVAGEDPCALDESCVEETASCETDDPTAGSPPGGCNCSSSGGGPSGVGWFTLAAWLALPLLRRRRW